MSETKHISLRFSNQDLKSGATEADHNKDIITSFSMTNSELSKHIKNKKTLTELCSNHFASSLVPNDPESLIFYRKSKKHKDYVLLETEEDFKSLSRSLQVKNLLKLNIQKKIKKNLDDEVKAEDAEPTTQDAKRRKSGQDFTDNLSKSLFFELGEAVLQTAFEHFKDAVSSKDELENKDKAPAATATGNSTAPDPSASTFAKENTTNSEPKVIHHQASCDSCNPVHFVPIVGPRYKCLLCNDFDLCAKCMVKKVEIGGHTKYHPMAKISTTGQYDVRPPSCGNSQRRQYIRSHFGALGLAGPWTHPPHPPSFFGSYHGHGSHGHGHRGYYRGCGFAPAPPAPPPPPPPPAPPSPPTPPNPAGAAQFSAQGNDIIYDIPLGSCSLANRDKLENILRSGNIDDFFRNVDLYIEESRRYKDLVNSLNTDQDSDEKYACLLSLVEQINLDNAKDGSLKEEVRESTEEEELDVNPIVVDAIVEDDKEVFVEEKKDTSIDKAGGSISVETLKKFPRCLALFLTNNSIYSIPGEKLEFEFFNNNDSFKISVPVPKDFLPDETKYANLRFGHDDPDFPAFGTCKLRIPTSDPSIFMEGDFLEKGTTLHPVSRERKEIEKASEDKESKVLVSLHIKADYFAQIVVTNYTESEIDCSDLRFEIINCFHQSICNLVVHKRHAILPGRTSRFNISLSSAHLKYPFKLVMKNDSIEGECDLSLKNLSGAFKISKKNLEQSSIETDSAAETASFSDTDDDMQDVELATKNEVVNEKEVSPETETDIEIREDEDEEEEEEEEKDEERDSTPDGKATTLVTKSVEELRLSDIRSSSPGEVHSMVLPTLPRESTSPSSSKNLSSSEYLDANSTLLEKETSEAKEDVKENIEHKVEAEDEEDKLEEIDADYDIVSSDAGEDFGSDYEILSPVTSNNQ